MIVRPFEHWLFEDVEIEFGIERIDEMSVLQNWLSIKEKVVLPPRVEQLRLSLSKNVETWNEDELKMLFISPFLLEFEFNHPPAYRVFTQRFMKLKTETVESSGRVEWMVATGKQRPRQPFFFLQEYKPEKNSGNDPLGQLLIALVDAQIKNEDQTELLYGCYTIGRFWFFVLLKEKQYSVSRAYDATQLEDIQAMYIILKKVEAHIQKMLKIQTLH
ncbi:MAG: hypothetical protein AAF806_24615 [Bacteroidota bacterium]